MAFRMLHSRGYCVTDPQLTLTYEDFHIKFGHEPVRSAMTILARRLDDESKGIFVFWPDSINVGVDTVRDFVKLMWRSGVHSCVLIIRDRVSIDAEQQSKTNMGKLSNFARAAIMELPTPLSLETFGEQEMALPIFISASIPEQVLLSHAHSMEVVKHYSLQGEEHQFPRIKKTDVMARFWGMREGQLLKTTRVSEVAGMTVSYRMCVV